MPYGIYKHEIKHGMCHTRVYRKWASMKTRCLNKNRRHYKNYGGRGITICDEWMDFQNFYRDMGECPSGLTLERIDNDKGYCKSNCKWATSEEQVNNKRTNHFLTYKGKTQTAKQWSEELGISYNVIRQRIYKGFNTYRILNG